MSFSHWSLTRKIEQYSSDISNFILKHKDIQNMREKSVK